MYRSICFFAPHTFFYHLYDEMRLWGAVVGYGELGGVGVLQADMGEVITSLNKLFHIVVRVAYFYMFFIQQIIIKYACY